ncbi:MAG: phage holin family protein [Actinobacteria bacterium]|nr:phage holin family protein [Actinomycetota bacterium]
MADWTTRVVDAVDGVVDTTHEKIVEPVQRLGRGVVYGLLGAFFFLSAFILLAVGAFRALVVYLPEDVWAAHLIVGGILVASGLFLWSKRR